MFKKKAKAQQAIQKGVTPIVYTDKAGNKYWTYEPLALMPAQRFHDAQTILEGWQARLGPTTALKQLKEASRALEINVQSGPEVLNTIVSQHITAKTLIDAVIDQLNTEVSAVALLEIAAMMYLWNDEKPLDTYENMAATRLAKLEVWKHDHEARDFFLRMAWKRSEGFPNWSETTTLPYLVSQLKHQETMQSIIRGLQGESS
jgi:hypothetical protein